MTSIADGSVIIQTSAASVPAPLPGSEKSCCWLRIDAAHDVLTKISERVRFARRRFGRYEVIDFLAVLAGLCHQWGTHPGGVLREASALCGPLHGAVWA